MHIPTARVSSAPDSVASISCSLTTTIYRSVLFKLDCQFQRIAIFVYCRVRCSAPIDYSCLSSCCQKCREVLWSNNLFSYCDCSMVQKWYCTCEQPRRHPTNTLTCVCVLWLCETLPPRWRFHLSWPTHTNSNTHTHVTCHMFAFFTLVAPLADHMRCQNKRKIISLQRCRVLLVTSRHRKLYSTVAKH